MAQVVATRSIQSSFLRPNSGSVQEGADKLRPQSFAFKVLVREEKIRHAFVRRISRITAKRSTHTDSQVIPVSPEDVPKVCLSYLCFIISIIAYSVGFG